MVCSAQHTCFSSPPLLTISGILGSDQTSDTSVSDGVWERRVERRWTPKEEDQIVKCTVRYQGGQTATSELRLNVECKSSQNRFNWIAKHQDIYAYFLWHFYIFGLGPYEKITMTEHPIKATEGVAQSVICSVLYKCRKNTPTIVWNYSDMQRSISYEQLSNNNFVARSNLTFIGSLDDNGTSLTCTAQFLTGNTSDSTTIHVKSEYRFYTVGTRGYAVPHFLLGERVFHLKQSMTSRLYFSEYEKPIEVVKMKEGGCTSQLKLLRLYVL